MSIRKILKESDIIVHGKRALLHTFKTDKGIGRKRVGTMTSDYVKILSKKGFKGEIMLTLLFPSKDGSPAKWRNVFNHFKEINDEFHFDFDDIDCDYWGKMANINLPNKFLAVQFQIISHNEKQGGNDPKNDCLYNCLNEIIPRILKRKFPTPESLKSFCGLKRYDPIPLEKIKLIETKLSDCKINVRG
jgi:hypothetical protein